MSRTILVAGDVCLDVVGVPIPAPVGLTHPLRENWRLTGELRTHLLPGGAMLLAEFIRNSFDPSSPGTVFGPEPVGPQALAGNRRPRQLTTREFLDVAERFTREEIVHSLLTLNAFPSRANHRDKELVLRVEHEHGYSGPESNDPSLKIKLPAGADRAQILVLDDTGNRFRNNAPANPWPSALVSRRRRGERPFVIYKLHRPLPEKSRSNPLWSKVASDHGRNRLVIATIEDLRSEGAPISQGLSWERTALDVVWHLLNNHVFTELRNCPLLIIRLGLDGAILWQCDEVKVEVEGGGSTTSPQWIHEPRYRAHLIYDPSGIEGSFAVDFPGTMVACGSAFAAELTKRIATAEPEVWQALTVPVDGETRAPGAVDLLLDGVKAGLIASREVLRVGFGKKNEPPHYPKGEVFPKPDASLDAFASREIPIIPEALAPDRGGWRLLDDLFENERDALLRAVTLTATRRSAPKHPTDQEGQADAAAAGLLSQVPLATFKNLRTFDRREIEFYRALYTLLRDYLRTRSPARPLSIAVFGPPGAGKSFGVKQVAAALKSQPGCKQVTDLTFNLSLLQSPDDLAGAFHLVRDVSLRGEVPLVFFDEFDGPLGGQPLGWLRCFLAPMQDGVFLDRGAPHPIGPAVFVFAGGTCNTYADFSAHRGMPETEFKSAKGPDFLSRLRGTLDVPSLDLPMASGPRTMHDGLDSGSGSAPNTFDAYGPIEAFPSEAAILLRRAGILAFSLGEKAPQLTAVDGSIEVDPAVLRALLQLPSFAHGNRSFEAMLEMSHLSGARNFLPCLLPADFQISLHADAAQFEDLVGTAYPYSKEDREAIARAIHEHYVEQLKARGQHHPDKKPSHRPWAVLEQVDVRSNEKQADDIPRKLFGLGLWLRKAAPGPGPSPAIDVEPLPLTHAQIEQAAKREHDRWVAALRSKGYVYGEELDRLRRTHPCLVPWGDLQLSELERHKDRDAIRAIPRYLAAAGYEVIKR